MPHENLRSASKAFAISDDADALNAQLIRLVDASNSRLDSLRVTKLNLSEMKECFGSQGSDWLRQWNRQNPVRPFQSKELALAAVEDWKVTICGYEADTSADLAAIRNVLTLGADPNTGRGHPLWLACKAGNNSVIRELCCAGASLERRRFHPYAAYYGDPLEATWACGVDRIEAAKLLIQLGCKPADEDIYWANRNGSEGVAQLIRDKGFHQHVPPGLRGCAFEFN